VVELSTSDLALCMRQIENSVLSSNTTPDLNPQVLR
jgi:hypothetical protein